MNEILRTLNGCWIPSVSGRVEYQVTVRPGESVTVGHPARDPSVLKWEQIRIVYEAADASLTPKEVDEILEDHPATHNASTMCALVLAMKDPSRVIKK